MNLSNRATIRLDENEEKFLKEKATESNDNITDIIKKALNQFYDTDIFISSQQRKSRKWGLY